VQIKIVNLHSTVYKI